MSIAIPGARAALSAYRKVGVETGVSVADPHRLILMLYDGALLCIAAAKEHMAAGRTAEKGENLSKAIDIISNGLKASLDVELGGELAGRLAALYDYMCVRLLYANARNNPVTLDEVRSLLVELKEAWSEIGEENR
jgi:flagellar protein FliS